MFTSEDDRLNILYYYNNNNLNIKNLKVLQFKKILLYHNIKLVITILYESLTRLHINSLGLNQTLTI